MIARNKHTGQELYGNCVWYEQGIIDCLKAIVKGGEL